MLSKAAAIGLLAVLMASAGGASAAAPAEPHYIGPITGNAEKDTFGYAVPTLAVVDQLCIVGPAHYVGRVTGDPESDNYAFTVSDVAGATCSAADEERQRDSFQQRWLPASRFGNATAQ